MNISRLILFLLFFISLNDLMAMSQDDMKGRIFKPEDQQIVQEKLTTFSKDAGLPMGDLVVKIGLSFLGTPYESATLENGLKENLIINLRELDCTTFVENCLALARTVKLRKTDFGSFVLELEHLRYRDGKRNQYPSRLHYFTEWIQNNQKKGIVDGTVNQKGIKSNKVINFMSTHPLEYSVLKEYPGLIPAIAKQEKELTKTGFMYFPKDNIPNLYNHLKHGDIIALTSSIEGVDVNHVGIILMKDNEYYLLHAPLSGKKVLISEGPITDFIKPNSKNTGIVIARPIF